MEIVREGKEGGKGRMARFSGGIGSVGLRGNRERTNAMRRARRSPTGYCPRCNGAVHLSEIKPLGGVLGCSLCRREIRATSLAGGGRGRAPASLPGRSRPRASALGGAPEGGQGSMDDLWREGSASEG